MAVTTYNEEFVSPVSPSRLFKALVTEAHIYFPKALPNKIKNVESLEGDGGVGSIHQTNFVDGGHMKYMKHRMDVLDKEKMYCKYTLIGSDINFEKVEFIVYEAKFEAVPGGGSVCKMTSEYHVKAGFELKVEEIKEGKLKASGMFKAVEEYLNSILIRVGDEVLFDGLEQSSGLQLALLGLLLFELAPGLSVVLTSHRRARPQTSSRKRRTPPFRS